MKSPYSYPAGRGYYGIFNDSFPPILDGVTLTVENYVKWIKASGGSPVVVTPWNPVSTECDYPVMRFFSLPIRSRRPYRYGYPKLDPFIWRRLRNTDFKILHSHCPFSSGRLAVYVKRHQHVPLVGTFHSKYKADLEHSFKLMPWAIPIIMRRILDFFNACDEVWIPQAHVEPTVREYGYKGKLRVMENGNDFSGIITGDVDAYKAEARRRVGLDGKDINLLFVGQHIWEKGLKIVFETLLLLRDKVNFHMNFIGTGYAADEMKRLVEEKGLKGKVTFHGVINERATLSDHYAANDLFVFPSYYDNAPLVVREAAAMGTPSILTEGSTASEVVTDRKNGFLSKYDAADFARTIEWLAGDRDELRRVARGARASLVRSWRDVVDEVMEQYDRIIKERR